MLCLVPRRARVLALLLGFTTLLTACGGDPPPPPRPAGALAIVVGARSNMPPPTLPDTIRDGLVKEAARSGDQLSVVSVSGTSQQTFRASLTSDCDGATACGYAVDDAMGLIEDEMSRVRPAAPEADTLGAVAAAARGVRDVPGPVKQILVIDNGLQTTGEFTLLRSRAVFSDPAEIARTLQAEGRLPDLTGLSVTWVGLGAWSPPQAPPAQRSRDNLQAIWEQILRTSGATAVSFTESLDEGTAPATLGLPPVTPVDVSDGSLDTGAACPTIFDDQVGFVRDEATFVDPQRARDVLEPLAQGLVERRQAAQLTGYVARPGRSGPGSLSERRAAAVRDVLVDLGVPADLLTVAGAGLAPGAEGAPPEALAQFRRVDVTFGDCAATS